MISKKNLIKLSKERLQETKSLIETGNLSGANYLMGFSIELILKAIICDTLKVEKYPDSKLTNYYTHDFSQLMYLSGLKNEFDNELKNNHQLATSWEFIQSWNVNQRYIVFDFENLDINSNFEKVIHLYNWLSQKLK